ncbi:OmpA family protein [Sphingobacterium suaedae]|uniref:OmpA family protein n=1 Tax=Sphingobacterium suaedae TaxID=1686402 RepID=A0ABW5KL12_9SPHI
MKNTHIWTKAALVLAVSMVGLPAPSLCQSLFNKVKARAESAATSKILNETDKAVSKGIDKAIESASSPNNQSSTPQQQVPAKDTKLATSSTSPLLSFSKYDFIPGDSVIYSRDFATDVIGELPVGWNSNGSSVVVRVDKVPGHWLRLAQRSVVLSDNEQGLGQNFTVEFDLILDIDFKGWMPPSLQFGLIASGDKSPTANALLNEQRGDKSLYMEISPQSTSGTYTLESNEKYTRYFNSAAKTDPRVKNWYGRIAHVALHVQQERVRIWIDGEKLYDAPKGIAKNGEFNQIFFKVSSSPYADEQIGMYINHLKIAKGAASPRQRLLEGGSFSTTGIHFDSGSSRIKPESTGVIKSIADILKENTALGLLIVGHTDNTGDAEHNLLLSKQRSAAVKELLVAAYGIDRNRLTTDGKGESAPLASNNTPVGKAQNRRVDFMKQ